MTDSEEITFRFDQVPPCARCAGEALLRVRFGHSWTNITGHLVEGFREADLCPACDSGTTPADDLLALFTVAETIPLTRMAELGCRVVAWVESLHQLRVDIARLRSEEHAYRHSGELP
ncbi:DUF6300 family protein [Streptomyces sp. WAC8370]|uniref:DUF6300 family protein n=1 Tax=unclassified Streptomyces TaxID=2593676 RepID=UPI0004C07F5B|nr:MULTISPECIES: DUF6300 family protein [unclassified Streptomyces]KOU08343.1 hypothetical protein ADK87_06510 [Streptomyces sp. NRRL F-4711]